MSETQYIQGHPARGTIYTRPDPKAEFLIKALEIATGIENVLASVEAGQQDEKADAEMAFLAKQLELL